MLALPLVGGCNGSTTTPEPEPDAGSQGEPDIAAGRDVFLRSCALCHALGDAQAVGTLGPDLDQLRPTAERVRRQVRTGGGAMPPNIVEGQQAEDVAAYVAEVAGRAGDDDG